MSSTQIRITILIAVFIACWFWPRQVTNGLNKVTPPVSNAIEDGARAVLRPMFERVAPNQGDKEMLRSNLDKLNQQQRDKVRTPSR